MNQPQPSDFPHRRYNPLTGQWVLVSPHRANRPWQGQVEKLPAEQRPAHDPACYLCPGNVRANGEQTPEYGDVFAFTNDFSALLAAPAGPPDGEEGNSGRTLEGKESRKNDRPEPPAYSSDAPEQRSPLPHRGGSLFTSQPERGICRVICFSPRHDLTIPEMEVPAIRRVIDLWRKEYAELGNAPFIRYVQIFENKGEIMGCSNPHPHGQIWAQEHLPDEPLKKQEHQARYYQEHGRTLLEDYLKAELDLQQRILFESEHFVTLVPYWAVWPFEAMIVPKRAMPAISDLTEAECNDFAAAYRQLTICYDNLFEVSFPYSAGIHQAPTDGEAHPEWHWHMVFYPPLLRSATVKKFMVGYEMLAGPQRDISPERAAAVLRGLPAVHYKTNAENTHT